MKEWNREGEKVALLIHPMLGNADLVKELIADNMGDGWHFLIPDLSGHGSSREWDFTEIAKEADYIHSWLEHEEIRHLDLIWGASLGAAVALSLIRYVDASFGRMVLDGAPYLDAGRLMRELAVKIMIRKHRKAVKDHDLSVRKMTELFGAAGPYTAEEFINISEESLAAVIRSCGSVVYPVLKEAEQRNTLFLYGEDDPDLKGARKKVPEDYPAAELRVLPGHGHCAMIGKDTASYVKIIRDFSSR